MMKGTISRDACTLSLATQDAMSKLRVISSARWPREAPPRCGNILCGRLETYQTPVLVEAKGDFDSQIAPFCSRHHLRRKHRLGIGIKLEAPEAVRLLGTPSAPVSPTQGDDDNLVSPMQHSAVVDVHL